jgi:hypothetical protein
VQWRATLRPYQPEGQWLAEIRTAYNTVAHVQYADAEHCEPARAGSAEVAQHRPAREHDGLHEANNYALVVEL